MTHNEAWERVLAAVAAEAQRAEAILHAPLNAPPFDPSTTAGGVPANWTLPAAASAPLPPLSEMPPVPEELRERIEELQSRISDLQAQLSAAMSQCQQLRRPALVAATPAEPPHFMDRRV